VTAEARGEKSRGGGGGQHGEQRRLGCPCARAQAQGDGSGAGSTRDTDPNGKVPWPCIVGLTESCTAKTSSHRDSVRLITREQKTGGARMKSNVVDGRRRRCRTDVGRRRRRRRRLDRAAVRLRPEHGTVTTSSPVANGVRVSHKVGYVGRAGRLGRRFECSGATPSLWVCPRPGVVVGQKQLLPQLFFCDRPMLTPVLLVL